MIYELRVYQPVPGQMPKLLARFRQASSHLGKAWHPSRQAEIEQRQKEESIAIAHHHRLAVHDPGQLLHCHRCRVAHALQALG